MHNFDQNIIKQIKQLFKDCKIHLSAALNKRIKETKNSNLEIINYCQNYLVQHQQYEKLSCLIISICEDIELPKCKICGKVIAYTPAVIQHHNIYCSSLCAHNDLQYRKKLSKSHKNKTEQEKRLTLQKRRQTCINTYGTDNVSKVAQIKQRKIDTCQKNFGVAFPMQSKYVMQKSIETNLNTYGVRHVSQREDIKQQKKSKRYPILFKNLQKYSEYIVPAFTYEQFFQNGYTNQKWQCKKCGQIFTQEYYYYTGHIDKLPFLPRCLHCFPLNQKHSNAEDTVVQFIKSFYNGKIQTNTRNLISPKQLDIVLPELNIAIEYNGNYWHSQKPSGYHLQKTQLCQKIGYRLIHIWQDEWRDNSIEVQNKLKSIILNQNQTFMENELILDRCWYSSKQEISGYNLVEILPVQLIEREEFLVENCGYLKYWKI